MQLAAGNVLPSLRVISPPVATQVEAEQRAKSLGQIASFATGVGAAVGVGDAVAVGVGSTTVGFPPEPPPHAINAIDSAIKKARLIHTPAFLHGLPGEITLNITTFPPIAGQPLIDGRESTALTKRFHRQECSLTPLLFVPPASVPMLFFVLKVRQPIPVAKIRARQSGAPDFAYLAAATSMVAAKLALSASIAEATRSPEFAHI